MHSRCVGRRDPAWARAVLPRLAAAGMCLWALAAQADARLPPIEPQQYDAEQRQAADAFVAARHAPVFGPFEPLMYSPQVMTLARGMGDYLRYHSALGNTLSELAILITARAWTQSYEWSVHAPIAQRAGIGADVIAAIGDGRRPSTLSDDEDIVYAFCTELNHTQRVSQRTFERAEQRFGKKGVVDLTGIIGYYTFLAMQLNVAQYPTPPNAARLARWPE